MPITFCPLPLPALPAVSGTTACNDAHYACVRLLRRANDTDRSRFIMSGKLGDVCAALEQLAALEQRNVCRNK